MGKAKTYYFSKENLHHYADKSEAKKYPNKFAELVEIKYLEAAEKRIERALYELDVARAGLERKSIGNAALNEAIEILRGANES